MREGGLGISASDGRVLVASAREAIAARIEGRAPRWPPAPSSLSAPAGAFVTLRLGPDKARNLRGCIGRMAAQEPLVATVREMALSAAFEDPRFPPLSRKELDEVSVEVTVLGPMRQIERPETIEAGRHGVLISKGSRSAVFLPQVATEQGWGREELLDNLCYKAGLPVSAWRSPEAKLFVFEGEMFEEEGS